MKKVFLTLVLTLGMYASTASALELCSAVATDCGLMTCIPIPEGGSCVKREMGSRASATTYDAYGNLYAFEVVRCPFEQ